MYTFDCKNCRKSVMMPDSAFGRSEECPFCSQRFMITNPVDGETGSPWVVQWMGHVNSPEEEKVVTSGGAMERFARWMTVGLLLLVGIAGVTWYSFSRDGVDKVPEGFYATALNVAKNIELKPERDEAYSLIVQSLAKSDNLKDAERLLRRVTDPKQRFYANIAIAEAKYIAGDTRTAEREFQKISSNLQQTYYRGMGRTQPPNYIRDVSAEMMAAQLRCGMARQNQHSMVLLYFDPFFTVTSSCDLVEYHINNKNTTEAENSLAVAESYMNSFSMFGTSIPVDDEIALLLKLAKAYRLLGKQPEKTKEYLENAFDQLNGRISEKKSLYFMQIAEEQYLAGLHEAAEKSLDEAEKAAAGLDPRGMEFAKIKYLANTARTDEAIELGKKFLAKLGFDEYKFIVADYIARLLHDSGKHADAVAILDEIIEATDISHPNVSHFYFMLVDSYFSIEESGKAIDIYNQKNDLFNYDEMFILLLLVGQYHRQGLETDDAETAFTEAVRRIPLLSQPLYLPPSMDKGGGERSAFKVLFDAYDAPVKPLPTATSTTTTTTTKTPDENDGNEKPATNETPTGPVVFDPESIQTPPQDEGPIEFDGVENESKEPKTDQPKPIRPVPIQPVQPVPLTPRVQPGVTDDNAPRPVPVRPAPVAQPQRPAIQPAVTDENAAPIRPAVRPPRRVVNPNVTADERLDPAPKVPPKIQRDPFGNPIKVVSLIQYLPV